MEDKIEEMQLVSRFISNKVAEIKTLNSSHGDGDFREAIFATFEDGSRLVIKAACNGFTDIAGIKMWQRCVEEYRKLGCYAPRIMNALDGTFPKVSYKGHECIAYAEEFSEYETADKYLERVARDRAAEAGAYEYRRRYLDDIYRLTARVAAQRFDYAETPSGYCLFELFPGDTMDEVSENALDFSKYCKTLPEKFAAQGERIYKRWVANRAELEKMYFKLPFSVFQADFNETNVLVDSDGNFVGLFDFNLAGRDEFLNYLFRETFKGTMEEELAEILHALKVAATVYDFTPEEIAAAPLIYRCVKPIWFCRVDELKSAGSDEAQIQKYLDAMEYAQTREIDFAGAMK